MNKVLLLVLIVIFFLQYSFIGIISNSNAWGAGLMVGFVVSILLKERSSKGLVWAMGAGLLMDYFSNLNLGTFVIIFILLAATIEIYKAKFAQSQNKYILVFICMLLGVFFVDLLIYLFMEAEMFFGKEIDNLMFSEMNYSYYFFVKVLISLIGVVIYKFIDKIYDLVGRNINEIKVGKI